MFLSDYHVYAPKPSAVSGHKYRQNLPTYNKATFIPGDTTMLNILCGRRGQFLNQRISYLKFKLNNMCQLTAGEAAANPVVAVAPISTDYSGSNLFARLELYPGSNLLEQIHDYNVLHALWSDMTGSAEAQKSTRNVLEGIHARSERTGASIALDINMWHFLVHAEQISSHRRYVRRRSSTRDHSCKCK
jgi:hypothetical protein